MQHGEESAPAGVLIRVVAALAALDRWRSRALAFIEKMKDWNGEISVPMRSEAPELARDVVRAAFRSVDPHALERWESKGIYEIYTDRFLVMWRAAPCTGDVARWAVYERIYAYVLASFNEEDRETFARWGCVQRISMKIWWEGLRIPHIPGQRKSVSYR